MTRGDSAREGPNSTLEETFYDINKRSDKELEREREREPKLSSVCPSVGWPSSYTIPGGFANASHGMG